LTQATTHPARPSGSIFAAKPGTTASGAGERLSEMDAAHKPRTKDSQQRKETTHGNAYCAIEDKDLLVFLLDLVVKYFRGTA
jgi:hypothetical protein